MPSTKSLKEQREAKMNELEALMTKAEAQEDGYTDEQRKQFDSYKSEIKSLDEKIAFSEEQDAMRQRIAEQKARTSVPPKMPSTKRDDEKALKERFSLSRAILQAAEGKLSGAELEVHQEGKREFSRSGIGATGNLQLPSFAKRDLLAETATAGQENVATDVYDIVPFLYGKRVTTSFGAQVWSGLTSNVQIPRNDASGSGAWEGEGDAGAEVTPTFDTATLQPKRFGGYINLSKQLLAQAENAPGIDTFATDTLRNLIDTAVESAALVGGGVGEPTGIVGTLSSTVDMVTNVTRAGILSLEQAVADSNAEMGNLGFITNPRVRANMKTVDAGSDTGFFLWDGRYMSNVDAMPGEGMVEGYRAATTTLLPDSATAATNYIIYGNWNDLVIGRFGGLDLVIDPYSLSTSAKIRVVANVWVDVALLHEGSFAYGTFDPVA